MNDSEPLWEILSRAYLGAAPPSRFAWSRYLCTLADWLVPEENDPPVESDLTNFPWPPGYQAMSDARWEMRQTLRYRLMTEAYRAEEGE